MKLRKSFERFVLFLIAGGLFYFLPVDQYVRLIHYVATFKSALLLYFLFVATVLSGIGILYAFLWMLDRINKRR